MLPAIMQPARRELARLDDHARSIRQDVIRMIAPFGQGYVQQGLGAAELFATLYFSELSIDPLNASSADRDRCILSGRVCLLPPSSGITTIVENVSSVFQ